MKRLIIGLGVVVLALVALLGWKVWDQRAALRAPAGGSGVVEGTTVRLSSRVGGRIAEIPVKEGEAVAAGDLIVRLDCVEPEAALAEATARVDAARQQAAAAQRAAGAAGAVAGAAAATAQAADAQSRAVNAQGTAADRQAGRLDAMSDDVSAAQRDQARAAADGLAAQTQAAAAQHRAGSAQARAASEQAAAASATAEAALQQVAAGEAALARARLAVDECRVVAPRVATVQLLPYEAGELVGPGMTVGTLVDITSVKATFYLPNADLGAVKPGLAAEVLADAWPDRSFTGTVSTVSADAEFTPRNIQTRTDRDRLVYKVEVEVANPDGALRPGMPVQVRLARARPAL